MLAWNKNFSFPYRLTAENVFESWLSVSRPHVISDCSVWHGVTDRLALTTQATRMYANEQINQIRVYKHCAVQYNYHIFQRCFLQCNVDLNKSVCIYYVQWIRVSVLGRNASHVAFFRIKCENKNPASDLGPLKNLIFISSPCTCEYDSGVYSFSLALDPSRWF